MIKKMRNMYTLVILDYEISEVRILQVDNDEIERKWNDDVAAYITGRSPWVDSGMTVTT